jgi:hypothetical protein
MTRLGWNAALPWLTLVVGWVFVAGSYWALTVEHDESGTGIGVGVIGVLCLVQWVGGVSQRRADATE